MLRCNPFTSSTPLPPHHSLLCVGESSGERDGGAVRRLDGGMLAKVHVEGATADCPAFVFRIQRRSEHGSFICLGGGGAAGDRRIFRAAMKCVGASGDMEG